MIRNESDDEKKEENVETQVETIPSDSVEGKPKEEVQKFTSPPTELALSDKKSDDSGEELIKGIQKESTYIGAWADGCDSDSEDESDDEEEIFLDSFGRPATDNSAW